jgi:enoyl-[acyl-carrier-protein] reductase (NADH)
MHLPLIRPHYHCAGKGKQTLKATSRIRPAAAADLTEKQCRKNKIAAAPLSLNALVQ